MSYNMLLIWRYDNMRKSMMRKKSLLQFLEQAL